MKIGIMADTHDHMGNIQRALAEFRRRGCEAIIHAGDFVAPFALKAVLGFEGKVYGVLGNNDGERSGLKHLDSALSRGPLKLKIGLRRIVVIHDLKKLKDTDRHGADVVVYGHTHEAGIVEGRPMMINPGECAGWLTGCSTAVILDTETMKAELVNLGAWA